MEIERERETCAGESETSLADNVLSATLMFRFSLLLPMSTKIFTTRSSQVHSRVCK